MVYQGYFYFSRGQPICITMTKLLDLLPKNVISGVARDHGIILTWWGCSSLFAQLFLCTGF